MDRIDYLISQGVPLSPESETKANYRATCLSCGKKKLNIKSDTGAYHCWSCPDVRGSFHGLCKLLGVKPLGTGGGVGMGPPLQTSDDQIQIYQRDENIQSYAAKRGLTVDTLRKARVGVVPETGLPVYPLYWNGKLVGIKYKQHKGARLEGAESPLYTPIPLSEFKVDDPVVVVEGEEDALTLMECGIQAVATLGATKTKGLDHLRQFKKVYLGYDMDPAGEDGATKASDILGRYRCRRIEWPEKDVNDWYQVGATREEIKDCVLNARPYPNDLSFSADEVFDLALHAEREPLHSLGWPRIDSLMGGGYAAGSCIAVHAEAGVGKTTWVLNLIRNQLRIRKDITIGFASLEEHPVKRCTKNLIRLLTGGHEEKKDWARRQLGRLHYYKPKLGGLDELCQWVSAEYAQGTRLIFIDHFHLVVDDEESTQCIKKSISRIVQLTRENQDLTIFLIVQPKNTEPGVPLSFKSMRGGASIGQAIDGVLVVERSGQPNVTRYRIGEKLRSDVVDQSAWMNKKEFLRFDRKTMRMTEVVLA